MSSALSGSEEGAVWRGIIGHARAVAALRGLLAAGRAPHALLFEGPEQVGKTTVARAFVAALLCERGEGDGCGECRSCKAVAGNRHPDVIEVIPRLKKSGDPGGGLIRLWQITDRRYGKHKDDDAGPQRALRDEAKQSPFWGRRKCFIIEPAHAMEIVTANALLKTLEEPPPASLLILVTPRPEDLPVTILSRCRRVVFEAVPFDALRDGLAARGIEAALADELAREANGRPGAALQLAENPDLQAAREAVRAVAAQLHSADPKAALLLADELRTATLRLAAAVKGDEPEPLPGKRRDEESDTRALRRAFPTTALLLAEWLRMAGVAAEGRDRAAGPDAAVLRAQGRRAGRGGLARAAKAVQRSIGFVESNVAPELVFEALVINLLGAMQGGGPRATRTAVRSS